MKYVRVFSIILSLFFGSRLHSQHNLSVKTDTANLSSGFRGACVLNDKIAWLSGSKGVVAKSTDGGANWTLMTIPKEDKSELRDVEAWDENTAVVLSVKDPAQIFRTTDGGATWESVYKDETHRVFLDGMAFWDKNHGIAFGDPLNNHFVIIITEDGGKTWKELPAENSPLAVSGESGFAASGTGICVQKGGWAWFGTGGSESNIFVTGDYGKSWTKHPTPVVTGMGSKGINSVLFLDENNGIIVGGDFTAPDNTESTYSWTHDGGKTWHQPHGDHHHPGGYRSCVEQISKHQLVATGMNGTDISHDAGKNWHHLSKTGFYVVSAAKKGKWVVLAGQGVIGRLEGH